MKLGGQATPLRLGDLPLKSGASAFYVVALRCLVAQGMKFDVHWITDVGMMDPWIHVVLHLSLDHQPTLNQWMDVLWNVFLHHGLRNWRVESVMQGRSSAVAGFWIAKMQKLDSGQHGAEAGIYSKSAA